MSDRALTQLSAARHALAECKTVMQAKQVADAAEAARVYLERTKASVDTVNEAMEIRAMAEKQMGEFLAVAPDAPTGPKKLGRDERPNSRPPTLKEMGITKDESSRAQKLAALTEEEFRRRIEAGKAAGRLTIAAVVNPPQEDVVYDASTDEEQVQVIAPGKPAKKKRDSYKLSVGMWVAETVFAQIETIQEHDTEFVKAHEAIIALCQERLSKHWAA